MNTRGIIMLAGGAIAGYLIYDKFIKKNGGETTESFAGRNRVRRPTTQKAGGTNTKLCMCGGRLIPVTWEYGQSEPSCDNFFDPNDVNRRCGDLQRRESRVSMNTSENPFRKFMKNATR